VLDPLDCPEHASRGSSLGIVLALLALARGEKRASANRCKNGIWLEDKRWDKGSGVQVNLPADEHRAMRRPTGACGCGEGN
jgi:hypothetical protein